MVPVTVAVGHSSALVSAGLAAALGRVPGFTVKLWQDSHARNSVSVPAPQLIFGDFAFLERLRNDAKRSPHARSLPSAKFVLVTNGEDQTARASQAVGEIDECLPLECPEDQFFAIVNRLVDGGAPANGSPAMAPSGRIQARGGLAPGVLRRVREHIEQNLMKRVPIGDLAAVARLSPGHFNRAFKQSTGSSPHQYVMRRRIAMSTELIVKTCRSLAEIALDVGFAHQSHFSRTFAAATGETPLAYRRRNR